jgi:hypothetical protein
MIEIPSLDDNQLIFVAMILFTMLAVLWMQVYVAIKKKMKAESFMQMCSLTIAAFLAIFKKEKKND